MPEHRVKVGQRVRVRSLNEILRTLDPQGCTGGIPFMPEMLPMCEHSFRVKAIANKACVEGRYIGTLQDVYVLQTPKRCDGSAHGGCQMACNFFWRREWVEVSDEDTPSDQLQPVSRASDVLAKATLTDTGCYRCQATALVNIAQPSSPLSPGQYVKDLQAGIPASSIGKFLFGLAKKKLFRTGDSLVGPCEKRTPVLRLNLAVGQRVRVRSLEEIQTTLDTNGCNRGLWFDPAEMAPFCGKQMVVSRVIRRLIDEATGELKELKVPSIVLSETECSGVFRRFCSRGMLHFWREIWLERIDQQRQYH